jgi:hypothetical protein
VRDHQRVANMTRGTSERIFSWRSLVDAAVPQQDPDDDDDETRKTAATMPTANRPLLGNQTKISCTKLDLAEWATLTAERTKIFASAKRP